MLDVLKKWYHQYFSEEESVLLLLLLCAGLIILVTVGDILTPVFVAVILAYLMQGIANRLQRSGLSPRVGVAVAMALFISCFFGVILGLLPLVWRQLVSLAKEAPAMVERGRQALSVLPENYPSLISQQQINQVMNAIQSEMAQFGQIVVAKGFSSIPGLLALLVYMVLIPLLVFFLLKDREKIMAWGAGFLPAHRPLLNDIWAQMNRQFSNYARGKVIEIIIVGVVSYVTFKILGLDYAALLGLLVGLSVIIPYIGAALVTIPVLMVAFFQWGLTEDFYWVFFSYGMIQALDGNVLVPLLFSEAVNLHPIAIIVAVLFFGGIWGVWGVFFAIPLATLISAVVTAWPTAYREHQT